MSENRIEAVERRAWWPEAFVDEIMPEGRSTPDAWIIWLTSGTYAVEGDEANGLAPILLSEGQEVLFTWCDDLGTSRVTIGDDGIARWNPAPPAAANHFWSGDDPDTICDTTEDFSERQREYGDDIEICCLTAWGNTHMRCRFTALNGPPRFIPLDCRPDEPAPAVEAPPFEEAQASLI